MADAQPDAPQRSNSASFAPLLVRAASSTLTGGAAYIPEQADEGSDGGPNENTPIRQTSTRNARRSQADMQARLAQEVQEFLFASLPGLCCFGLIVIVLLLVSVFLWVLAALAAVNDFADEKPCDQPLRWYLIVGFLWSQLSQGFAQNGFQSLSGPDGRGVFTSRYWAFALLTSLPGWALLGWGVYMLVAAKTCPKTNPQLYFPTQRYIICQIVLTVAFLVVAIVCAFGLRRLLLLVNTLIEKPGCVEAVRKLPKVEPGSKELIDSADGEYKACIICLEELSEAALKRQSSMLASAPSAVVRTPCGHYFHEDCLATWSKNHVDCPLCRTDIGEPDP